MAWRRGPSYGDVGNPVSSADEVGKSPFQSSTLAVILLPCLVSLQLNWRHVIHDENSYPFLKFSSSSLPINVSPYSMAWRRGPSYGDVGNPVSSADEVGEAAISITDTAGDSSPLPSLTPAQLEVLNPDISTLRHYGDAVHTEDGAQSDDDLTI
ncbi:hypothetical protein Dimus_002878 [Dionaea muscipula]